MSIQQLRNQPAKSITQQDFEKALIELKIINNTINVISYDKIDDVLYITFEITVKEGGFVKEQLKFGQFISLVESGVSTEHRQKKITEISVKNTKKLESAKKAAATREAKKPENNITKNGNAVKYNEMIDFLVEIHQGYDYDSRFIKDIAAKSKLTSKQHNYLCKVAAKSGYSMPEKTIRKKKINQISKCDHQDLGSLGFTHGDTVKCPFCGKMAVVW